MIKLSPQDWYRVEHLFADHRRDRPWIDATFEGYFDGSHDHGLEPEIQVWVDDPETPAFAQLVAGKFRLLAGDASSPLIASICASLPAVGSVPPWHSDFTGALLAPEDEAWTRTLAAYDRTKVRMRKKVYSTAALDVDHLTHLVSTLDARYELRQFDLEMAQERGIQVNRARLAFVRLERFFERGGLSFWILKDGKRVSEATSFGVSQKAIDVGIGTEDGHTGKGLATVVGAALLLEAIKQGKEPHWFTVENPRSDGLALKLGYALEEEYDLVGFG